MSYHLTILHHDEWLIAVDKPPGLLVHRSRIDLDAEDVVYHLRRQIGRRVFPVHRLDRPTSGVLLFALDSHSARKLAGQFADRTVTKRYTAIVRGHTPSTGIWDEPLKEKLDKLTDRRARTDKAPQPAITRFETLNFWTVPYSTGKYESSRYSLVSIRPETGRKHQIRRHFNHMAHPIIGDTTFGDRRHNRLFQQVLGTRRLMLAATTLRLQHPETNELLTIEAPAGEEFAQAIEGLETESRRSQSTDSKNG